MDTTQIPLVRLTNETIPLWREAAAKAQDELNLHIRGGDIFGGEYGSNPLSEETPTWLAIVGDKVVGLVAGMYGNTHYSEELVAQEIVTWFDPAYRRVLIDRMFKEFEDWAKARGCVGVFQSSLVEYHTKATDNFYRKRGYIPVETHYYKEFKDE